MRHSSPVIDGLKICSGCLETKPKEEFHRRSEAISEVKSRCKKCLHSVNKDYRHRHRDRIAEKARLRHAAIKKDNPLGLMKSVFKLRYGLTIDGYKEIFDRQNGLCAICLMPGKEYKRLSVDHDHLSGKVRGLLCHKCNMGIGLFDDNEVKMTAAINYLREKK